MTVFLQCSEPGCGWLRVADRKAPGDTFSGISCDRCGSPAVLPPVVKRSGKPKGKKGCRPMQGDTYAR